MKKPLQTTYETGGSGTWRRRRGYALSLIEAAEGDCRGDAQALRQAQAISAAFAAGARTSLDLARELVR